MRRAKRFAFIRRQRRGALLQRRRFSGDSVSVFLEKLSDGVRVSELFVLPAGLILSTALASVELFRLRVEFFAFAQ